MCNGRIPQGSGIFVARDASESNLELNHGGTVPKVGHYASRAYEFTYPNPKSKLNPNPMRVSKCRVEPDPI